MTKAELNRLKSSTKRLSQWESSGKAFGHYKVIARGATPKKKSDKIYEFFCLLKLLEDLDAAYSVKMIPSSSGKGIFPESPAKKQGWAYFIIENRTNPTNKFQVCFGTRIKLSKAPKTTIAPDISIQKHNATDDPDESMVELIMDAKLKFNDKKALPVDQLHAFIQRVNALQTQGAAGILLVLSKLTGLKGNCLLTNGLGLDDQRDYCVLSNIKQIENFDHKGGAFKVIG